MEKGTERAWWRRCVINSLNGLYSFLSCPIGESPDLFQHNLWTGANSWRVNSFAAATSHQQSVLKTWFSVLFSNPRFQLRPLNSSVVQERFKKAGLKSRSSLSQRNLLDTERLECSYKENQKKQPLWFPEKQLSRAEWSECTSNKSHPCGAESTEVGERRKAQLYGPVCWGQGPPHEGAGDPRTDSPLKSIRWRIVHKAVPGEIFTNQLCIFKFNKVPENNKRTENEKRNIWLTRGNKIRGAGSVGAELMMKGLTPLYR